MRSLRYSSFACLFIFLLLHNQCGGSLSPSSNLTVDDGSNPVVPSMVEEEPPAAETETCSEEICDGQDNDCDQFIDEDLDFCEDGQSSIPPDPTQLAPELDLTVSTTTYAATEFLYTGANPIQTGMDPATIEAKRVAVIRGRVLDWQGDPLPGVTISIKDHPEYGQTTSRMDGWFDMAVNGGGVLTVLYAQEAYLPAMRHAQTPWQGYTILEDVVLLELDPQVSEVNLDSLDIEVASGSVQSDEDGERQATLLFKPGTSAEAVLEDGSVVALDNLSLRVTEFTVGENGPKAMPAPLPPTSAYTYAVDMSVEEAMGLGARSVEFNQAVPFYVENFLGFPVGLKVPLGVLDPERQVWVAEPDGRVIEILEEVDGLAMLDITGDGLANPAGELLDLGIDEEEQLKLAELYDPGQSLWRVELHHFSVIDLNYPPISQGEAPSTS